MSIDTYYFQDPVFKKFNGTKTRNYKYWVYDWYSPTNQKITATTTTTNNNNNNNNNNNVNGKVVFKYKTWFENTNVPLETSDSENELMDLDEPYTTVFNLNLFDRKNNIGNKRTDGLTMDDIRGAVGTGGESIPGLSSATNVIKETSKKEDINNTTSSNPAEVIAAPEADHEKIIIENDAEKKENSINSTKDDNVYKDLSKTAINNDIATDKVDINSGSISIAQPTENKKEETDMSKTNTVEEQKENEKEKDEKEENKNEENKKEEDKTSFDSENKSLSIINSFKDGVNEDSPEENIQENAANNIPSTVIASGKQIEDKSENVLENNEIKDSEGDVEMK